VYSGENSEVKTQWTEAADDRVRPAEDTGVILLSITNKMQRYTIFFIIVNALRVSGGFSGHHQELKNCTHR
jgi:hypothetical protein